MALTNEVLWSEDFSNAAWDQSQVDSLTPGAVLGPDGVTMNGHLVQEANPELGHNYMSQVVTNPNMLPGRTWTASFALRLTGTNDNNSTVRVRISRVGGTFEAAGGNQIVTSDWLRYKATITWTQPGHTGVLVVVQGVSGGPTQLYITEAILNEGSDPIPYIKTEGSPATIIQTNINQRLMIGVGIQL